MNIKSSWFLKLQKGGGIFKMLTKKSSFPVLIPMFLMLAVPVLYYCKVICPDYLEHPIIQTHVKTSGGIRTVAPLGTWEGMIFSKEMDNAIKYGYKFEILRGYTFNQAIVFDKYINELYTLRLIYPKSDPMNYIAKLLMNSLYGRYGMSDKFTNVTLFVVVIISLYKNI